MPSPLKCPLFILNDRRVQLGEETEIGDCIKDNCAWWDGTELLCAIRTISVRLGQTAQSVTYVANELQKWRR